MKRLIKNIFYKDSRLVIKRKSDDLPDGGLSRSITVNMMTFSPYQEITGTLNKSRESIELTGTYGLNPLDIFNPFKENQNIVWLMMYQQGLIKDVAAEIIHPHLGSFAVTVNNPQVGQPYATFYNSPIEMEIPSPLVGKKIYLDENQSAHWESKGGIKVYVGRNPDTRNKEFIVII